MTRLYLIRHAENTANLTKEFSHRKVDYSLTDKGRLQAEQTAKRLSDEGIRAVYSSPLRRAQETAAYIGAACAQEVIVMEQFREINVGILEERPPTAENWAEHNEVLRAWRRGQLDTRFPDGEDYHMLWQRAAEGYRTVVTAHPTEAVAIVAHGGVFTATIKALCPDVDLAELFRQENHNCSITVVDVTLDDNVLRGQLRQWAAYDHLHGVAAEMVSGSPSPDFFTKPSTQP